MPLKDVSRMDTVRIEFEPWPPYTAKDIHEKLVELSKEFGLEDCSRWGLVMELPTNENSWKFCKRMRMFCGVYVFSSE